MSLFRPSGPDEESEQVSEDAASIAKTTVCKKEQSVCIVLGCSPEM